MRDASTLDLTVSVETDSDCNVFTCDRIVTGFLSLLMKDLRENGDKNVLYNNYKLKCLTSDTTHWCQWPT